MSDVSSSLREATRRLRLAGAESPRLSAEVLLAHVLGCSRLRLATHPEDSIPPAEETLFNAFIERRCKGEPVSYLTGSKEFFGREFKVTPATLIPRPETELLIESVLNDPTLPSGMPLRFADIGTGSGCIAITIAAERPAWTGIALDFSADALEVARANAITHHVDERIEFIQADMRTYDTGNDAYDCIVANPPYIPGQDFSDLMPDVRIYEPSTALVPDGDITMADNGMVLEEAAARLALHALKPGGVYFAEHGADQEEAMVLLFKNNNWVSCEDFKDLHGKSRLLKAILA